MRTEGFFQHFSGHCVFQAFAGLDESGDRRIAAGRPAGLAAEQAAVAVSHQNDDGRVDAWEGEVPALHAAEHVAGALGHQL